MTTDIQQKCKKVATELVSKILKEGGYSKVAKEIFHSGLEEESFKKDGSIELLWYLYSNQQKIDVDFDITKNTDMEPNMRSASFDSEVDSLIALEFEGDLLTIFAFGSMEEIDLQDSLEYFQDRAYTYDFPFSISDDSDESIEKIITELEKILNDPAEISTASKEIGDPFFEFEDMEDAGLVSDSFYEEDSYGDDFDRDDY